MNNYEIWLEGYIATGESSNAVYHGLYSGKDFKEACVNMMKDKKMDIKKYYNADKNTYWGCQFFDNEVDARKSFG